MRSLVVSLITLASALACGVGCQVCDSELPAATASSRALLSLSHRYARISPLEIDPSLTVGQIDQMFLPLEQVPSDLTFLQKDPNDARILAELQGGDPCQDDPRKAYLRGRWLWTKGKYRQAADQLQVGLACDPNNVALWELLAQASAASGHTDRTSAICKRTVELDPDSMVAYRILGDIYSKRQYMPEAMALYRQALLCPDAAETNPQTALVRLKLATTLSETGHYHAAIGSYRGAYLLLERHSRYSHTDPLLSQVIRQSHLSLLAMAGLYVQLGQIADAVSVIEETQYLMDPGIDLVQVFAMSLSSQKIDPATRFRQVLAYCRYLLAGRHRQQVTIEIFHNACENMANRQDYLDTLQQWSEETDGLQGFLPPRLYAYGLSLAQENGHAREILLRQLHLPSVDARVHGDLARSFASDEQWRPMLLAYRDYLQVTADPTAIDWSEMESHLRRIGDLPAHLELWQGDEAFLQSFSGSFLLGALAQIAEDEMLAEQRLRHCLALKPDFQPGRVELIELLLAQEKFAEVLEWIGKNRAGTNHAPSVESEVATVALESLPSIENLDEPVMIWYAARACLGLGFYENAQAYFRKIISSSYEDVRIYLGLGEALYQQQAFAQAEKILLKVLENGGFQDEMSPATGPEEPVLFGHTVLQRGGLTDRQGVYRHLVNLYCRWNAHPDIDDATRRGAHRRARQMLRYWLIAAARSFSRNPSDSPDSGQWDPMVTCLEALRDDLPQGPIIRLLLSELYVGLDRLAEALLEVEALMHLDPEDQQVLALGAELGIRLKDFASAATFNQQLWQLNPQEPKFLVLTLTTMRLAGRTDEALALLLQTADQRQFDQLEGIKELNEEALRLFRVTHQWPPAVDLFQKWFVTVVEAGLAADEQWELAGDEPESSQGDDPDDAIETVQRVGQNLVWLLVQSGSYDHAVEQCRQFYQQYEPTHFDMALQCVRMLNLRHRFDLSRSLLRDLVARWPDKLVLRHRLYITMIEQRQESQSLLEARQWLADGPDQRDRQLLLVTLLHRLGEYEQAADLLGQWVQESSNAALEYLLVETWILDGKFDEAEARLSQAQGFDRQSSEFFDAQIRLEIARQNCPAALEKVNQLTRARELPENYQFQAQILAACGQEQEALELMKKVVEEKPQDDSQVRLQYSIYLERTGRIADAIAELEALLELFPTDAGIKNNLGYLLTEAGIQIERTDQLLRDSYAADPDSGPTLDSLGWFYYKRGDFAQALEYIYQAAAAMAQIDAEVWDHLGDTAYRLGRQEQAKLYWQQASMDLNRRVITEHHLQPDLGRVNAKLKQLTAGEDVAAALLFSELAHGLD